MENGYFMLACENVERKEDKKVWHWADCLETAHQSGAKVGTLEFWLVYKIRVYETHGDYKFCVAGAERLAQDIGYGVTPKQVEFALKSACKTGKLHHVWCDKKVYRNKTKIYVTEQWLKDRGLSAKQIKVLSRGRNNTHKLAGKVAENGKIINAEIVENPVENFSEIKQEETKTECVYSETECIYPETECVYSESPLMNKYNNKCKRISKKILAKPSLTDDSQQTTNNFEQEFEEIWQYCPNKQRKADGKKAYIRARKKGVPKELILTGMKKYASRVQAENTPKRYIRQGGNWFKGESWEDENNSTDENSQASRLRF